MGSWRYKLGFHPQIVSSESMDLSAEEITMLYTALRDQRDNLLRPGTYKIDVDILMKKLNRLNLQKDWWIVAVK